MNLYHPSAFSMADSTELDITSDANLASLRDPTMDISPPSVP